MLVSRARYRGCSIFQAFSGRRSLSNTHQSNAFQEGESIVLYKSSDPSRGSIFVQRLDASKTVQGQQGKITHIDIIGKLPRDVVNSSRKIAFRLTRPSLDEYVRLTPRIVTPIYPGDANLIVSLLDLHPDPNSTDRIEILEAGTGHGGLTLHMARAVHAANASLSEADLTDNGMFAQDKRRAVIHTIEIAPKHSERAQAVVRGFRAGLYARNVDFHVGTIEEFLEARLQKQASEHESDSVRSPFLTHAMLDLPGTDLYLDTVTEALRPDGTLIVFNPSITQIAECVRKIQENKIPLQLEQVLELGSGMSAGKEWDVRLAQIRAATKAKSVAKEGTPTPVSPENVSASLTESEATGATGSDHETDSVPIDPMIDAENQSESGESQQSSSIITADQKAWAMVCRPKAGKITVGGGFVGIWRKKRM